MVVVYVISFVLIHVHLLFVCIFLVLSLLTLPNLLFLLLLGSPWTEESTKNEKPAYQIPQCYEMPPPALKASHLKKFHARSLFFMFYSMPRDILQAYAAKELHTRGWRFHKELRLWFSRDTPTNGQSPQFVYFDSNVWEKRIFDGNLPQTGFMTDADMNFDSSTAGSGSQGGGGQNGSHGGGGNAGPTMTQGNQSQQTAN